MASALGDIQAAAMALSSEERMARTERLLASMHFDPWVQKLWLDEADRPYSRLPSGEGPGLSIERVSRTTRVESAVCDSGLSAVLRRE